MKHLIFALFIISPNLFSQYTLQTEHLGGATKGGEFNMFRAAVTKDGKTVASYERSLPFDVPYPAAYLHEETGCLLLSHPFDGFVEMFSPEGKKLWETNFFKEMSPNYERTITAALGHSSIVFLTSDVRLPNAVVHRFLLNGKKEWEKPLPYPSGFEIAMSADEQTIAAGSYYFQDGAVRQEATLMNSAGIVIGKEDILFRTAAFSDDNQQIALASDRDVLVVTKNKPGTSVRKARSTDGIITDMIWDGTELLVQESQVKTTPEIQFYYADPVIVRHTESLQEISRMVLSVERFKTSKLRKSASGINLHCSGRTISLPHK